MTLYLFKTNYSELKHLLLFSCSNISLCKPSLKLLPVKKSQKHEYINSKYNKLRISRHS